MVEVDLLIEGEVVFRPLPRLRIAGVIETGAIGVPGQAPTGRAAIDTRHNVAERCPGLSVINVHRARFAAALGERDRNLGAVGRGHEEIDGGAPGRIQDARVEQHLLGG